MRKLDDTEFDRCALFDVKHIKALPMGVVQSVEQHGVHTPLPPVQLYDFVVQLSSVDVARSAGWHHRCGHVPA